MKHLLAVLLTVLLTACASSEFTPATSIRPLPPYTGAVRVLERLPAGNYVQLGIVTATGGGLTRESTLLSNLKTQAAQHGANAIVLQNKQVRTRKTMQGTESSLSAFALRINR